MYNTPPNYRSFVLRIWKERRGAQAAICRFSLEDPSTNVRHGFQNIDQLISYLQKEEGGGIASNETK